MSTMKDIFVACSLVLGLSLVSAGAAHAADTAKYERLVNTANEVLVSAIVREGAGIPPALLSQAKAIMIFPNVVRAGFFWGGRFGEGITVARTSDGSWSAPAFYTVVGGSWGLQIGVESVDIVLLVMNDRGFEALLKQKFTIGADISATAGPNTASAQADIDIALKADIVSYSQARGLFAGVALRGARIAPSPRTNRDFYGRSISVDDIIVRDLEPMPSSAAGLMSTLAPYK